MPIAIALPLSDMLLGIKLESKLTKNTSALGLRILVAKPLRKACRWLLSCNVAAARVGFVVASRFVV